MSVEDLELPPEDFLFELLQILIVNEINLHNIVSIYIKDNKYEGSKDEDKDLFDRLAFVTQHLIEIPEDLTTATLNRIEAEDSVWSINKHKILPKLQYLYLKSEELDTLIEEEKNSISRLLPRSEIINPKLSFSKVSKQLKVLEKLEYPLKENNYYFNELDTLYGHINRELDKIEKVRTEGHLGPDRIKRGFLYEFLTISEQLEKIYEELKIWLNKSEEESKVFTTSLELERKKYQDFSQLTVDRMINKSNKKTVRLGLKNTIHIVKKLINTNM